MIIFFLFILVVLFKEKKALSPFVAWCRAASYALHHLRQGDGILSEYRGPGMDQGQGQRQLQLQQFIKIHHEIPGKGIGPIGKHQDDPGDNDPGY
jgi:hypothetical protein